MSCCQEHIKDKPEAVLSVQLQQQTVDRSGGTYIIFDIDITHALVIELLLHVGDGSVVSGNSVDACIFQTPVFYQLATNLHNQGHILEDKYKNTSACLAQKCFEATLCTLYLQTMALSGYKS